MSDKLVDDAIRSVTCPFCGAPPGQPCTTHRGTVATYLHALRFSRAVYAGTLPLVDPTGEGTTSGQRPDLRERA